MISHFIIIRSPSTPLLSESTFLLFPTWLHTDFLCSFKQKNIWISIKGCRMLLVSLPSQFFVDFVIWIIACIYSYFYIKKGLQNPHLLTYILQAITIHAIHIEIFTQKYKILPSHNPQSNIFETTCFIIITVFKLTTMFFPHDEAETKVDQKIIFIYETNSTNRKPYEIKVTHKRLSFNDVKKTLGQNVIRLFNSDGAEYFQDDLKYIKHKTVLYATKGEEFDSSSCFGQYEIGKKLGEGGFGNVFLAKHMQTGQKYAIKIIKTENIGSVSDIDSIFVEAEILKSLNHQNIVKVHNCLTLKNMEVAIIMQFLQGGELLKYVQKQGRLEQKTAQTFFKQIVKGMRYCHQHNLIHRDLKLQNILLVNSQEKKIKIIDFGIAGAISFFTQQDLDTGSLAYMAPECFTNNKDYKVDGRIDVWATGVILYCMLNGTLPFKGSNSYQTIELIKAGKFKLQPDVQKNISEACIEVLNQCLQINPKKRINMQQLADHPWLSKNVFVAKEKVQVKKMQAIKQQLPPKDKVKSKVVPSKSIIGAAPKLVSKASKK